MENRILCIAVLFTLQFSGILCRNSYYEYYYSKYHKGHSTTEAISSSTSGTLDEEVSRSSVSDYASVTRKTGASSPTTDDDSSLENMIYSSKVDHGVSLPTNVTVLQHGISHSVQARREHQQNTGLIIGIILLSLFVAGIIICCCSCCIDYCCANYRNRARKGYVVLSNSEAPEVRPQQCPSFLPANYVAESPQQVPPYYQSGPVRPHAPYYPEGPAVYQNNPAAPMQSHNFPEAPPPYDAPTYEKN